MKPNKEHPPPKNPLNMALTSLVVAVFLPPVAGATFAVAMVLTKIAPGLVYAWLALWLFSIVFILWRVRRIIDRLVKHLQNVIGKVTGNRSEG